MTKKELIATIRKEYIKASKTPFFKEYVLTGMKGSRLVPEISDNLETLKVFTNYEIEIKGKLSVMATLLIYYYNWFAWSTDETLTPAENQKLSKASMLKYDKMMKLVFNPKIKGLFDPNIYSAVN